MAGLLWGKVYYKDQFAGTLRQDTGGGSQFQYDESYLNSNSPAIAHTIPLRVDSHVFHNDLPPFFDNLVAEGWLETAQTKLLGKRVASRFELLLAFGYDCAGAVYVVDPEPVSLTNKLLNMEDPKELAIYTSRASLSGVQPKLALILDDQKYRPTHARELSTHIAKFPSNSHVDLVLNEYLTMRAFDALLPDDVSAEFHIGAVEGQDNHALIVKRFDRQKDSRIHFEEFNQLLGNLSSQKYQGAYNDMSELIYQTTGCLPAEVYRLYARILAGVLLGNTDMHLKNFAMLHTDQGLRLAPSYDQVMASLYNYDTLALAICGEADLRLGNLKPKNIIGLGQEFKLQRPVISLIYKQLEKNRDAAKEAVYEAEFGSESLKNNLIKRMDQRWNGTFSLIGKLLSEKP